MARSEPPVTDPPAPGPAAGPSRGRQPDESGDRSAPRIGPRLRRVRQERGLTLAEVAAGTGLTKSFLSRLENEDTAASVASLMRICDVLGVRVASLFEPVPHSSQRRAARRPANFGGSGIIDYVLTAADERRAQVFETHLEPGATAGEEPWSLNGEVTVVYVVRGAFELVYQSRVVRLRRGEALAFDPREPHTWRNPSASRRAVVVLVDVPAMF